MANITAALVSELREKTGAGMMDCKKALVETNGDIEAAVEHLRKTGAAKAEKKAGRTVKEGKISAAKDGGKGVLIEILCETDFVAKNEKFIAFAKESATRLISSASGDGDISAQAQELEKATLTGMIATIGENMQIRRVTKWETAGAIGQYLHMGGRIGVMVDVEGCTDEALLTDICMHIAAFKPSFISPDAIPVEVMSKEKEIIRERDAQQFAGKKPEMVEKIIEGKMNKVYTELCLMNQPWFKDDKTSLSKLNPNLKVKRFVRWEVGEEA